MTNDHRMQHQPDRTGAPMHDVEGVFPDLYTRPELYVFGPEYRASIRVIQGVRGKPDADVTVYRSVPHGVTEINPGDWVSPSRAYAAQHGMHATDPTQDLPVISRVVRASELRTEGNSVSEWGWFPDA